MKHNFLRFLTLTALIFGSLSLWAKQYCGETITGTNGHQATVTFRSLGDNKYEFVFESVDAFTGYNADGSNFYTEVNGVGGTQVSKKLVQNGNKLTFTTTSNPAPNFYVGAFYVNYSNGECQYSIPIDEEWSACPDGSSEDEEDEDEEPEQEEPTITWSEFIGDGVGGDTYSNKYKISTPLSTGIQEVVNIQHPGFATADGIYMTFTSADYVNNITIGGKEASYDVQGAGIVLHLSNFTAKVTELVTNGSTFYIFYADGTEPGPVSDLEDPNLTITDPSAAAIELALNATKQITWTSSNTATPTFASSNSAAVEVSDAGLITANAIGSATITVKQDETDTYQEATKTITVTIAGDKSKNTECSGWDNECTDGTKSALGYNYKFTTEGTSVKVEIEFLADFTGMVGYMWDETSGFDEAKATVNGKKVIYTFTDKTSGDALKFRIKLEYAGGGMTVTKQFTYHVGEDCQPHPVTGVSITSTFTQIEVGQSMTMTAAVTPSNATNKKVSWSITAGSENATINSSGTLTGVDEGEVTVQVTTEDGGFTDTKDITVIPAKPTAPSALPAAPTHLANKVKAVYSDTYGADCSFGSWEGDTEYLQEEYGKKFTIKSSKYFGLEGFSFNCSQMEKLHLDVWAASDITFRVVPILKNGTGGNYPDQGVTVNITGQQWNSIDIALSEGNLANYTDWSNTYQIKINEAPSYITFWLNNIYFYTTSEETKYAVSAIAGDGGSATASASSVTSGTEVTFTATPDCGYQFDSWTKGGEVIVGAGATYTTAITEETTLKANFTTTFAPVTPTCETTNVMSVYGHYGNQTGLNVAPSWGQVTAYNETTIGGKKMARYTNINFQGWDFNANRMNVSDMQYIHLDLYASVESDIKFSLIWAATEQAVTKHLEGCTMESIDIPLSEFTNADLTTIRQLKFDVQGLPLAGKTLIVQNIYFYKLPPAPVESVTITNAPSEMAVNSDLTLTATIAPVNAGNKNVTWSITAGSDYATIDLSTGVLHATLAGQVTVQVTTEDGGKTDSKTITIKAAGVPVFPFTDDPTGDQLTQLSAWLNYYNGKIVDFTLPRSLSSAYFNTICLPFGLNSFAGTPFEGATVATLVDATVEGIDQTLALTLVFQPVTSMAAGVPYIIQPASDLTNPRFDDVTISATEAGHTVAGNADFVGCFAPKDVTNSYQNVFLAANNTLKWNGAPATIKGYRGYFAITGVTATSPMRANAPRLVIRNTPTEMQNVENSTISEKVIRNGQLVIIRNGVEYNAQGQVIQ